MKQTQMRGLPDNKLAEILNNHRGAILGLAKQARQDRRVILGLSIWAGVTTVGVLALQVWQWVS